MPVRGTFANTSHSKEFAVLERVESSSSCGRMAANSNSVGLDNARLGQSGRIFYGPFDVEPHITYRHM
jgi:hypothetical protein